jgi:PDZ domain-containing protein
MRHPAQHRTSNGRQLPRFSLGVLCSVVLALATPAAYAQHGGGGRFGGAAGGFSRGGMGTGRRSGGTYLPSVPAAASFFQLPGPVIESKPVVYRIGRARVQAQFKHRLYLGYGFWPVYGWASSWESGCLSDSGENCDGAEYNDSEAENPVLPTRATISLNSILVIYLRDGSGYGATDYWITDGMLHLVTTYDIEKSFVFEQIDWQRTVDDNAARGVYFKLSYSPSKQRRTPAIAPTCPAPSRQETTGSFRSGAGGQARLFGAAVSTTEQGLKVTLVQAGSPAAQVGINPGDVVLRIDCQQVHSVEDMESAIAANTSGAPWVSYLIKGAWLSEQQLKVR